MQSTRFATAANACSYVSVRYHQRPEGAGGVAARPQPRGWVWSTLRVGVASMATPTGGTLDAAVVADRLRAECVAGYDGAVNDPASQPKGAR